MTESQLQQQIISYLSSISRRYNFIYFAPMNEAVMMVLKKFRIPDDKIYRIMAWLSKMGFLPGISDIMILCNGKAYCMELKTATGTQQKSQILFETNCKKTGVPYEIVRSLDGCINCMRLWGVIQ